MESSNMPRTVNSLMRHLRETIEITGSRHKCILRNIGYFHGYKGYRFVGSSEHPIGLSSFDDIIAIYDFDMQLKNLLYPEIMFVETALKNRVLELVLNDAGTDNIDEIFKSSMTAYKEHDYSNRKYQKELKRWFLAREQVNDILSKNCKQSGDPAIWHFLKQGRPVPVWAIFEELTLGQFGNLYLTLKRDIKVGVAKDLGLPRSHCDGTVVGNMIFILKDLRNAVAHNKPVFDVRFKTQNPGKALSTCIQTATGVSNVDFCTITDYVVLISYLMKCMEKSAESIRKFLQKYLCIVAGAWNLLPDNLTPRLVGSDAKEKIHRMEAAL